MCSSKRVEFDKGGWKPVLGNHRRIGTKEGNEKPIREGNIKGNKQMFTLFVDNLPEDVSQRWVRYLFNKFGVVKDVYIPGKRSKVTGKIFGFVRYGCEVSADMAISKANGLWIEDRKLFVKMAYFDQVRRNDQRQIIPNKTLTGETAIDVDTSHRVEISTKGNVARSASYVNVVKGVLGGKGNDKRMEDGSVQEERKLCLKAEGNGWLYRSAVAKLHRLISIDELKVQMARMGVNNVLVRAMGGRSVILTCNNNEELENLLKVNCLQRWFSEIKSWEGQAACIERFVWLCCYGIPLNGWSNTSFKAIGELWGTFISTDEPTLKLSSFAVAKVLVATNVFEEIDEWINIEIEGKSYRVKVMEDPCDQPFEAEKQIPRDSEDSSEQHDEDISKDDEDDNEFRDHTSNLNSKMDRNYESKEVAEKDGTLLSGGADLRLYGDNLDGANLVVADSESLESSLGSEEGVIGAKGTVPILEIGITHDSQNSLSASQVEGINLLVDLNQKEGSSRCITQSFEEYCQRREASHNEVYVFRSRGVEVVEELPRQKSNVGSIIPSTRSSSDAILKMRKGMRRSERKTKKKKHLAEIEAKFDKLKYNNKKSSLSSMFFKEAWEMLDVGKTLGIELKGGRNYNLKKFVEMQEEELKDRIHTLDDFEENDISEDDDGFEENVSIFVAF